MKMLTKCDICGRNTLCDKYLHMGENWDICYECQEKDKSKWWAKQ